MTSTWMVALRTMVIGAFASLTLFPLVWMVLVSLPSCGEAKVSVVSDCTRSFSPR